MTTVLRLEESHTVASALDFKEQTIGRRVAIRKWFHSLYKEKPDEQFNGDECISIEEAESLVMVPSFNLNSAPTSTNSSKDASLENKQTHRHREKIREFKIHLKVKLSHLKHRRDKSTGAEPIDHKDTNVDTEETETGTSAIQYLFKDEVEQNVCSASGVPGVSAEGVLERSAEASSSIMGNDKNDPHIIMTQRSDAGSPTRKLSSNLAGTCRMKRQSNHDEADVGSIKRPCSGRETCSVPSAENVEDKSSNKESESSLNEKTPSAYLTNSPIEVDMKLKQNVSESLSTEKNADHSSVEVSKIDTSSIERSDDFSTSEDTSFSGGFSATESDTASDPEPCVTPVFGEKVYSIPTFRKKVRSLNVANIVRSFREGTLNEDKLIEITNKGIDGHGDLTFKNKEFYDDPLSRNSGMNKDQEKGGKTPSKEAQSEAKEATVVEEEKPAGTVKFDRFSCLIVYETSANPSSLKGTEVVSLRSSQGTVKMNQKMKAYSQSQNKGGTKSILKVKSNLRAKEENKRANDCDRVAVDSFMDLFEHFEHKKQMEECMLAEVREGQLNNYFSENFFPEILEDATITTSANSEFSRSRKATELNIGRKLGAINCGMIHYICETCDTPVVSRSVRMKRL